MGFAHEKSACGAARQEIMSRINGDKSRYNRERKQNIQRRIRTRHLLEAAGQKIPVAASANKIKAAPAK